MRLTEKTNNEHCNYDIVKGGLCKACNKLGQLEDLMEKYEIESVEELEKILADYDEKG